MQYAHIENGSIGYIGELPKVFKENNKFNLTKFGFRHLIPEKLSIPMTTSYAAFSVFN